MDSARDQRILCQHLLTDRLLGASSVPRGVGDVIATSDPNGQASSQPPSKNASQSDADAKPDPQKPDAEPLLPPAQPKTSQGGTAAGKTMSLLGPEEPVSEPSSRDEKLQVLDDIDVNEVQGCTKCELCHGRTQTVFGEGDPNAAIMFIGEGPGQNEDEQGRPFVGRAGELLTKMIEAGMGLQRQDVYIANVVKCRPPNNRPPQKPEVEACWGYLRRQIGTIRPRAIVTLGGPAAKLVLRTETGITRLRGSWHSYAGTDPAIPVMPTFHPAYLLRSYTKENRMKVWSDLKAVLEYVNQGRE